MKSSWGTRLAVWYLLLFIGSSLAIVALTYVLLSSSLAARDRDIALSTLVRYAGALQGGGLEALNEAILQDRATGLDAPMLVRVVGRRREALFLSMPADWGKFDLEQLSQPTGGEPEWRQIPSRRDSTRLEVASIGLRDGTLIQVGKSSDVRDELLARFRRVLLLVLALIVVVGIGGGTALTYSALQPLRNLNAAVRTILETGRFGTRVPVRSGGDALDELSALFNQMLDRIESLIEGMRGALDNVAHDLRTPMTRLRGIAETALQSTGPETSREALADCLEESERVVTMLNTLMDISEAETGVMRLELEPVALKQVIDDAIDLYSDVAEAKRIRVSTSVAEDPTVMADRNRMRQIVANLLDNALKYTPAGGHVTIGAGRDGSEIVLTVADTGPGIPSEELPRIWDRLYRGDKSRSERGIGLGLSLVKAVVEAHRGRVTVRSHPGQGSEFEIRLPAYTESARQA